MEFQKSQAIYQQIGEIICENILSQKWPPGEKIPSVRDLAGSLEVNPNTIMRTYTYLQDRGIIQNKRGIGYFVADQALENTRNLMKEEFITRELPHVFKTMQLLNITVEDLQQLFKQYEKGELCEPERKSP
jgi:GntR family transcriptional regulator